MSATVVPLADAELLREIKRIGEACHMQRFALACPVLSMDAVRDMAANIRRRRELSAEAHRRWGPGSRSTRTV